MKKAPSLLELLILLAVVGLISALCFSIFVKKNSIKADADQPVEARVIIRI